MTISDIIRVCKASDANYNAAKVPEWHGYVWKHTTGLTEADVASGKYKFVFVKANGDQYVYQWNGVSDFTYLGYIENNSGALGSGTPVVGTTLTQDPDLLEAYASDEWKCGSQSTYETRRTDGSNW